MREAYLTGGAAETPPPAAPSHIWLFSSVALTDEYYLTLTGSRMGDVTDEFTLTRYCKPHLDMLRTLRRLTLHMCLLTEELTPQRLYPQGELLPAAKQELFATRALAEAMETGAAFQHPDLDKFRCLSVQWKPKGVVLKGIKKARYRFMGKELEVKTPVVDVRPGIYVDEDEEPATWEYPYFDQLDNSLRELTGELISFMDGKYGEGGQQLELFGRDLRPDELASQSTTAQALGLLQEVLNESVGLTSLTISAGGKSTTITKTGKKGAANDE